MRKFAILPTDDKREIFLAVSASMGLRPEIIEKDFWVCFMLDYLFNECKYRDAFVFKGGTSLSKAYHVIKRFSEDIDIVLDWRKVLSEEDDPWKSRSRNMQDSFNKKVNELAADFYKKELAPCLNADMEKILGASQSIIVDTNDNMVINFYYPQIFSANYLRDRIRLEIGPLAEWEPSHKKEIRSFVSEKYPNIIDAGITEVLTVDAERTFWEKLTILHKLAHFPETKSIPSRYARHLYDVYCLANSWVKAAAFARKELLEKDIMFKQKFYYTKSANYERATLAEISLLPAESIIDELEADYVAMKNMIYGEYPSFKEIMSALKKLEAEVHALV